ncbi:hypothetical protein T02_12398 [Trichinella nativa]|uniref:Uncharacterized protein n=1 Tax=Trichinella nativa TaxID=6335 RepID=A0A0V1L133_9BILA|nr:hypothetical protein T02_12398 [Trichinella nativa]
MVFSNPPSAASRIILITSRPSSSVGFCIFLANLLVRVVISAFLNYGLRHPMNSLLVPSLVSSGETTVPVRLDLTQRLKQSNSSKAIELGCSASWRTELASRHSKRSITKIINIQFFRYRFAIVMISVFKEPFRIPFRSEFRQAMCRQCKAPGFALRLCPRANKNLHIPSSYAQGTLLHNICPQGSFMQIFNRLGATPGAMPQAKFRKFRIL